MRFAIFAAVAALLAGCAPAPVWGRIDGQVISTNPELLRQAETDRTICAGEEAKALLSSGPSYSLAGAEARGLAADAVMRGCMAQRGYKQMNR